MPIYPTPTGQDTSNITYQGGKFSQPQVKPSPTGTGTLKGTMITPKPSTPTVPTVPSQPQTSPFALAQVMSTLQAKVQSNNALMTQRNLLLKQLYNEPLNDQEKSQLDPTLLNAVNSNDRNQIDMRLRLISDEVAGRTNTLDSSVKFLTESYNDTIQQAEKQRQDAISNVLNFAQVYGSSARSALTSLYGPEYVEQLKGMGVDLDSFSGVKTLSQIKEEKETGDGFTTTGDGQYDTLLNTILGSGKFTKDQVKLVSNAIRNGEDPVSVIKNQAKNIMSSNEGTIVGKYETARSAMLDLQSLLKDFYAGGGKTSIFKGTYEKTINKLGEVNDPKLVDLATQIQAQLQVYRNAVSGTAYSEQEGADIASIFPGINKTQGLNEAIIKGRLSAFDSTINGAYKSVLGSAYDQIKSNSLSQNKGEELTKNGMTFKKNADGSYTRTK